MSKKPAVSQAVLERREAFLERLTAAMERRGLSQNEFARELQRLGFTASVSTVNAWFKNRSMPGGDYMIAFPRVLRVNGHWLLTDRGSMEPPGGQSEAQQVAAELVAFASDIADRFGVSGPGGANHRQLSDEERLEAARDAVRRLQELIGQEEGRVQGA